MPVDLIHEKEFASRLIRPDTWIITGHPVSAVTYLLIGGHTALVIDPGEHVRNLRDYVRTITDLPLIVANTHAHGDHTACNGQFKEYPIYASAGAVEELGQKRVDPNRYTTEVRYDYDYQALPIGDGHVFDLGGRRVRAIAAGCHSEGSLFYYDEKYQLLFTGDELECGQVLIQGSIHGARHSVERYRDNLLKVKRAAGRVDLVCPEHNGSPADGSVLDAYIENCERIMAGHEGGRKISSATYLGPDDPRGPERVRELLSDPYSRRSEWKGSALVYSTNCVFLKDE